MVSTPEEIASFYRALLRGRLSPSISLRDAAARCLRRRCAIIADPRSGLLRQALSCSLVWGRNGDSPGYQTEAYNSGNGTRQIVVFVNSDADYSWTPTERQAVNHLMDVAYCS